jgi:hypothetical protein
MPNQIGCLAYNDDGLDQAISFIDSTIFAEDLVGVWDYPVLDKHVSMIKGYSNIKDMQE